MLSGARAIAALKPAYPSVCGCRRDWGTARGACGLGKAGDLEKAPEARSTHSPPDLVFTATHVTPHQ